MMSGRRHGECKKRIGQIEVSRGRIRNSQEKVMNYAADYRNVGGIVVPTKRRVYTPDANKQKILDPVLVAIDIGDIAFRTD